MCVVTRLRTEGNEFSFLTYDSEGDDTTMTLSRLKREVAQIAQLVVGLDSSPRMTFIVHEAA